VTRRSLIHERREAGADLPLTIWKRRGAENLSMVGKPMLGGAPGNSKRKEKERFSGRKKEFLQEEKGCDHSPEVRRGGKVVDLFVLKKGFGSSSEGGKGEHLNSALIH